MKNLLSFLCIFLSFCSKANIRLPAIINNNMVLQQQSNAVLWGWSDASEKITVTTSWNNKTDSTKADGNAKWKITIPTPSAGGPYTITIKGNNTIILNNVLIGEVWVASGQSNMEMNYYWGLPQMKEDFPTANNPKIRLFHISRTTGVTPQENSDGEWMECDSNTVKAFSAVAYYFGRKLNAELNVPIGLVSASWGGTPAEVWTPEEAITNDSMLNNAANKFTPSDWWPIKPGYAYNGMIAPIINYTIGGVIWYQGETNTGSASTYPQLFGTMIKEWRKRWNKELPFYYVQLAPFKYGNKNIAALLREAQYKTLAVPNTGMVVTIDLADDTLDIHPKDKREVGYRLANLALAKTYNKASGNVNSPFYKEMLVRKNKATITFQNASALKTKGNAVEGFHIAGADKIFYPAQGKIAGSSVVVRSDKVKAPVAVRYAFSNTAIGNVFNTEGLPVAPFRTDTWEVDTSPVK